LLLILSYLFLKGIPSFLFNALACGGFMMY
jgi:hypothetical protein